MNGNISMPVIFLMVSMVLCILYMAYIIRDMKANMVNKRTVYEIVEAYYRELVAQLTGTSGTSGSSGFVNYSTSGSGPYDKTVYADIYVSAAILEKLTMAIILAYDFLNNYYEYDMDVLPLSRITEARKISLNFVEQLGLRYNIPPADIRCVFSTGIHGGTTCSPDGQFDEFGFSETMCQYYPCNKIKEMMDEVQEKQT